MNRLAETLLQRLRASRVTVRLHPERNMPIVAEALAPGVESMRGEQAIDQNAAATVRWVATHRATLVIGDARTGEPATPQPMIERYGLRAFMIAPLLDGDQLLGTVSVHVNGEPRDWTAADVAALEAARDEVFRTMLGNS